MAWTESGLFYATWRDNMTNVIAMNLIATGNNISLSATAETPDYASVTDPATWTNANEVTGGANWPTGGINLSTGTYAPTVTKVAGPPVLLKWDMNDLAIANTTTTAAAFGAYIYGNAMTPKAKFIGVWFGGTGYSTVAGTFAITWNVLGILTVQMAA